MVLCQRDSLILVGFSIISPLHLVNFMSVYLDSKKKYSKVYVGLGGFLKSRNIPDRYLDYCKKQGINFYENNDLYLKLFDENISDSIDFVFINDFSYKLVIKKFFNINKIYFIDEGVSTYMDRTEAFHVGNFRKDYKLLFKFKLKFYFFYIFSFLLRDKIINVNFFEKENYFINKKVKDFYIYFFNSISLDYKLECDLSSSIIYCTQPFVEMGVVGRDDFLHSLNEIKAIVEKKGYQLLIKKHPAEFLLDYENHGFNVLEFDGMIEEFVIKFPIASLISRTSTSSLLVNALTDIPCYILDCEDIEKLGDGVNKMFSIYCRPFELLE